MVAKWDSLLKHLVNVHDGHGEPFPACLHKPLHDESRQKAWLAPASEEYVALRRVLENKFLMKDIKRMSPVHQTSCLEAFHSLLLRFCPKHTSFSYLGMDCSAWINSTIYQRNECLSPELCSALQQSPTLTAASGRPAFTRHSDIMTSLMLVKSCVSKGSVNAVTTIMAASIIDNQSACHGTGQKIKNFFSL